MNKIGIFDSGVGGYTIFKQIKEVSSVDLIFLADQANLPYGTKTKAEVIELLTKDMRWFHNQGVDTVFLACNTASTVIEDLRERFPDMQIKGVIDETVKHLNTTKLTEVIVLATPVTIKSNQYQSYLKQFYPDIVVHAVAMPMLASMVEELQTKEQLINYFDSTLAEYKGSHIPVILGCTHYSLIASVIEEYLANQSYNSDQVMNSSVENLQGENSTKVYTTKDPENLKRQLKELFKQEVEVLLTIV